MIILTHSQPLESDEQPLCNQDVDTMINEGGQLTLQLFKD